MTTCDHIHDVFLALAVDKRSHNSTIQQCCGGNGVQEPMPKTYVHILTIREIKMTLTVSPFNVQCHQKKT